MSAKLLSVATLALAASLWPLVGQAQAVPQPDSARLQAMSDAGTYLVTWTASENTKSEQTIFLKNISKDQQITIANWEVYDCLNIGGKSCGSHDGGPTLKPGQTVRLETVRQRDRRQAYGYRYRFYARWTSDTTTRTP